MFEISSVPCGKLVLCVLLSKRIRFASLGAAEFCPKTICIPRILVSMPRGTAIRFLCASTVRRHSLIATFDEANGIVAWADFEDWCDWALAQADDLDPVKNLEDFLKSGQIRG